MHACGVRVVVLEHGTLGIYKSSVCTYFWTSVRYYFRANELSGREKSEAPCASIRWLSIRLSLVAPNSITRFDAAFLPTMVSMYPVT